jgi:predicted PurR-regulated permease PerM
MENRPSSGRPKQFRLMTPTQLRITRGGGCISVFGMPFLLAGIFVTLIGLQVIRVDNASEVPIWAWPVIILMGVVFTCVGGALVFGRTWITIDTGSGSVSEVKGLITPIKRQNFRLAEFDSITLDFIAGDSDSADTYEVNLKKISGGKLKLSSSAQYSDSYEKAVFLAEFMKMTLQDSSTENTAVLKPEDLEHSLKSSLSRHSDALKAAYPPVNMKCRISEDLGGLKIEIPSSGFGLSGFIPLIIAAGVTWYFFENFVPFFKHTNTPAPVTFFFTAFVLIFFLLLPVLSFIKSVIRSMRNSAVLRIMPGELELTRIDALNKKVVKIPVQDITDMDYSTSLNRKATLITAQEKRNGGTGKNYANTLSPDSRAFKFIQFMSSFVLSKGIIIKTRKDIYTFAQGLPDNEVLYIFSLIAGRLKGLR